MIEKFSETSELKFEKIDRKSPEILEALKNAPLYRKFGNIEARPTTPGEKITTILADGRKETENTANEGDWIVTNPNGEKYIISEKKFLSRYKKTDKDGIFSAKGFCKAIKNPYGKPIEIMASWGSPQTGDENCLIADICDEEGNISGEPYLIDGPVFINTYKSYQPEQK